jgi:hypothetical protein
MPATTPWYQGAAVPLTWTSTDTAGNPFEGSTVTLSVTMPDGTSTSPTVEHEGNGGYNATCITTQAGHHLVAWTAVDTSGHADAFADSFEVQPAQDGTIVSLAEAKSMLRLTGTTDQDAELQGFNAAATEGIEYTCGPVVVRTVMETLPARGLATMLSHAPVLELLPWTTVPAELANLGITVPDPASPMIRTRVYGIEYPLNQLYCDPRRGIVTNTSGLPFYYCDYVWQYRAGRPVIPAGIYKAAQIILEHLWQVRHGGTSAQDVAAGESVTTLPGWGFAIPNRAVQLLVPHDKTRLVAV